MTTDEGTGRAPAVELTAIGHGRKVRIDELGAPAALIFLGRETSEQGQPVTRAIRDRYPDASQVVIATITDVRGIPRLVRKVAQTLMKNGYNRAVENLQQGRSPEEYVLILPDWDGEVYGPLGIERCEQDDRNRRSSIRLRRDRGHIPGRRSRRARPRAPRAGIGLVRARSARGAVHVAGPDLVRA